MSTTSTYTPNVQAAGDAGWRDTALGTTESVIDLSEFTGRWLHLSASGEFYYGFTDARVDSPATTLNVADTNGAPPDQFEVNVGKKVPANQDEAIVVPQNRTRLLIRAVTGTVSAQGHIQ